jgi:hypothetical protein
MRGFIKDKMSMIFADFKIDLGTMGKFCELKNFRFDLGYIPDYSNLVMQRFYLLRFLPAYLTEYYLMYLELLELEFIAKDIKIVSFGCGCGIDFWGAKFASDDYDSKIKIMYTGFDIVKWNYTDKLKNKNALFINNDINKIGILDEDEYNVIMFPKSIGELDNTTFNNLKDIIRNSNFNKDRIILLSSIRKSRNLFDVDRLSDLVSILENTHHYQCLDSRQERTLWEKNDNGVFPRFADICDNFIYPQDIRNFIASLNSKCQGYNSKSLGTCKDDCDIMQRYPITTTSQSEYQILRLEKDRSANNDS